MFRIRDRTSDLIHYAVICWDCQLVRGHDTKKQAERAILRAADGGINSVNWYIEKYSEGLPDPSGRHTCPGCAYPLTPVELDAER